MIVTKRESPSTPRDLSAIAQAVPVAATARARALRAHPLLASALAKTDSRFDFEAFATAFVTDLAPVGPVEATLAARAAGLAWRLNRAQAVESAFLSKPDAFGDRLTPLENALDNRHDVVLLEGINRWEASLQRALLKILSELERRRHQRHSGAETASIYAVTTPPDPPDSRNARQSTRRFGENSSG